MASKRDPETKLNDFIVESLRVGVVGSSGVVQRERDYARPTTEPMRVPGF